MSKDSIVQKQIRVFNSQEKLEIRIPLKKNNAALVGLIIATLGWILILYSLVHVILSVQFIWYKLGLLLSIVGWFALGMAGASMFIWLFFGRERIIVTKHYFITDKPLVFFYRRNFYPTNDISNLHIDVEVYKINRNKQWQDVQRTVLKFDTSNKQVTFARGVEKDTAEYILLLLAKSSFLNKEQFSAEQKM